MKNIFDLYEENATPANTKICFFIFFTPSLYSLTGKVSFGKKILKKFIKKPLISTYTIIYDYLMALNLRIFNNNIY